MDHIIRWKVKYADGKTTNRMARVDAENEAEALKRFESCFGFIDNPYEVIYDVRVDSDSYKVMQELLVRYSDDSRCMARRVYNAILKEKYWIVVHDGKWTVEYLALGGGCPESHRKFLARELRKMFKLEPVVPMEVC